MSKTVKILIAMALALVLATPAMAAMKLNGYYRLQGIMQSWERTPGSQQLTNSFFDNRLRMKLTNQINDYITLVYYAEIDTPWGEFGGKNAGGNGGKLSADGVNVETKNAYVDFKIPDTSWKVRTGVQGGGFGGHFGSMVEDDDMAGIKVTGKAGMVNLTGMYSLWDQGTSRTSSDVKNYWFGLADAKVNDALNLGGGVAYTTDKTGTNDNEDLYFGVHGDYSFGNINLASFFLYRDHTNNVVGSPDGSAWMVDVAAKMKLDNGYVKLHTAYFPDNNDATDMNTFSSAKGGFEYHQDNMMLFLTDVYYNNDAQSAFALSDAAYAGYGLWFLTVSGKVNLPQGYYARYALGYFSALEDNTTGGGVATVKDTGLGTEIDAMVGKKFAEKYDVSLRGAYGLLGDFYASTTPGVSDPDDVYKVVAMVNMSF